MSVAQLPPLDFDSRGLRISLFQRNDTPPLVTPDPISGEPTVAEQSTSTATEPQIPERRRPQLDSYSQSTQDTSQRSSSPAGQESTKNPNRLEQHQTEEKIPPQPAPQAVPTQAIAEDDGASLLSETDQTEPDVDEETQQSPTKRIPTHPIASLQDAFAESLDEVTTGSGSVKPKLRSLNGKARRERLLDQGKDEEPFDSLWRYRPSQDQHEIMKLLAQISFGVYLLMNGMANSNSQVVNILQGHIDEVDEFLEVALEDLQQAAIDLNGRIDYLKLPMSNLKAFEELLEDRNFRNEILQGNEKIEHILARTNIALRQWDDDIEAGLLCSSAFTTWLKEQEGGAWTKERPDVIDIYEAMNGNAEGWQNAFDEMNKRAQELNNLIIKLMTIVAEMEKKAGEISRRTWAQIPPFSGPTPSGDKLSISSKPREGLSRNESMRSGSTTQPPQSTTDADNESISDYPLPGAAPLLPPPRMSIRGAQGRASSSSASSSRKQPSLAPIATSPPISEKVELNADDSGSNADEEPLYILQPRTYTPQPRESTPSPVIQQSSVHSRQPSRSSRGDDSISGNSSIHKQGSLRQRVSLKTKPPVSIQIPPRNPTEARQQRASPSSATPRTGISFARDPIYDSDGEPNPQYRQISRVASHSDLSPPVRPPLMPSPHSDHHGQFYRPVLASPHSPLQQRPHTSGTGAAASHTYQPSPGFQRQHVRNQPSRLGGMSMLSNVTNAGYEQHDDARTIATQRTVQGSKRTLKKKKSAFGWLKKAFTMDDEERAAYEARKAMQVNPHYYSAESPKFLDGRRIR